VRHRVPFYETDAMGIVHHANYVKYLELARVVYLDEHDRSYRAYMAEGLHFATTRIELDYLRPLRFDDVVEVEVWLAALRGASLRMAYALRCEGALVAAAGSEHALVDGHGRPQRLRGRFSVEPAPA
jgi:acyl-CoA thioester hydrolase